MINTLLLPEIRELLEHQEYDILTDFCSSLDSATVAEFLRALSPNELFKALSILDPHRRSQISGHLRQD
jgi:Mg/Co/Ni transporter MgtE